MRALVVTAILLAASGCSSRRGRICAEREALFETCEADGVTFSGCYCTQRVVETCQPNQTTSCYSGPEGTENVGACKAGATRCIADGTGQTSCEGQVYPSLDVCSTKVDEGCGTQRTCVDDTAWGRALETKLSPNPAVRLGTDADSNVYLLGGDLGPTMPAPTAIFRFSKSGALESTRGESIYDMAVSSSGRIAMLSGQGGTASCPPKDTKSPTALAVIDSHGSCIWSRGIADINNLTHVAWSPNGDLAVVRGSALAIGKRRGSDGELLWESLAIGQGATIQNLGVDGAGNIYAEGSYTTSIDFGTGPVANMVGGAVYLVKFSPDGRVLFLKTFDGMEALRMSVASNGNVALTGVVGANSEISFGGEELQTGMSTGLAVALLDADGKLVFSRLLGGKKDVFSTAVPAFDADGDVVVATSFTGRIDFAGIPLSGLVNSQAPAALGVVAFDSTGSAKWAMQYLSGGGVAVNDFTVAPSGAPVVAGSFEINLKLSWGTLLSDQGGSGFIAKLAP